MNLSVLFFAYFVWLIGLMHWVVNLLGVPCKYYFIMKNSSLGAKDLLNCKLSSIVTILQLV